MENKNQTPLEYFYESLDFLELRPMEWKAIEHNFKIAKEMENKEFEKVLENLDKIANKELDSGAEGAEGEIIKIEEIKK